MLAKPFYGVPVFLLGRMMASTVDKAGRKGGLTLLGKRGRKHFASIGKKGQEVLVKRYPGMASEWGKKGGRPKKNNI